MTSISDKYWDFLGPYVLVSYLKNSYVNMQHSSLLKHLYMDVQLCGLIQLQYVAVVSTVLPI